jgi:TonB family protein
MGDWPDNDSSSAGVTDQNPTQNRVVSAAERPADAADLLAVLRQSLDSGAQLPAAVMQAATDAARILSGADGIALALRTKGMIVCRARSGELAPELGTPLNAESGISGESLRTGSILVCHDTDHDGRVDSEVCRMMGIRSIVVVPLRGPVGMAGILEAFSSRVRAFGDGPINSLRDLASIAESAYEREARAAKEAALASLRAARQQTLTGAAPATAPKIESSPILEEPSLARRYWAIGAAVAAVLLVLGVWLSGREPGPEAAATTAHAATPAKKAVPDIPVPAVEAAAKPKAGVARSAPIRRESGSDGLENAAEVTIETFDRSGSSANTGSRGPVSSSATSASAAKATEIAEAQPPSIMMGAQPSPDQIAKLSAAPSTIPTLEARISEGVTPGRLIHRVEPVYPLQARTLRLAGNVVLDVRIGEDGTVREVKTVSGAPLLAAAATGAVKQWRYTPFLLSGTPIEVKRQMTVVFKLP